MRNPDKDTLVVIWTGTQQLVDTGRVMYLLGICGNLSLMQDIVDLAQERELAEVRHRLEGLDLRGLRGPNSHPEDKVVLADFEALEDRALKLLALHQPLPLKVAGFTEADPYQVPKLSRGDKARRRKIRGW